MLRLNNFKGPHTVSPHPEDRRTRTHQEMELTVLLHKAVKRA